MTVQVMSGTAAAEAPVGMVKDSAEKQPYVYEPPETVYEDTLRTFHAPRRVRGFGIVMAGQLTISVLLGLALWAGVSFGSEEIGTVCEGLKELFR